jgi:hypothetical protein
MPPLSCFLRPFLLPTALVLHAVAVTPVLPSPDDKRADVLPNQADYDQLLDLVLKKDRLEPGDARWLVELARQYRERFKADPWLKDRGLFFDANRVRDIALGCWLVGDKELAYRVMGEGFRRGRDEQFDPWFAAFAAASGRGDRALAELEGLSATMTPGDFSMKRVHLLRALGRGEEAMVAPKPERAPYSWMELAVEQEDWRAAIEASVDATGNSKLRDAMRHFIAILSRDPELLGRNATTGNRILRLLAGDDVGFTRMILADLRVADPIDADELREMGQDAALAVAAEARLTQALASGEPVEVHLLRKYFQYPDLLPDRDRSVRLAIAVAAIPRCRLMSGDPGSETAAHRLTAAEALLKLGKGDAAFTALRPVIEDATVGFDLPESWAWGGYAPSLLAAYRQAGKLATLAWPEADAKTRVERLAEIMAKPDPIERAKAMIGLAETHAAGLDKKALLQWLWLPLHDLASGGGLPDETMAAARKLLDRFGPDDRDQRRLENLGKPVNFALMRRFGPSSGGGLSFKPAPGSELRERPGDFEDPALKALPGRWDPKQPEFVVLDGLAALKNLLEKSRRDLADELARALIERLCLDRSLSAQRVQVTDGDCRFQAGPQELFWMVAAEWKFPAEWLEAYGFGCWCPATGYADDRKVEWAARAFARVGKSDEAARLQRIYLLRTLSPAGDDPAVDPRDVAEYVDYEAVAAARRGDRAALLRNFALHLRLRPYQPETGTAIMAAWAGGDAPSAEVRGVVDAFWTAKQLELPASNTYAHWREAWRKAIP